MYNDFYLKLLPLWQIVGDCYEGVEAIKQQRRAFVYLPPQPAERKELEAGKGAAASRYAFRKQVASYENFFKTTIDDIVGLMQKNKPKMRFGIKSDDESPKEVLDIRYKGTRYGDGLSGLKSRLNRAQTLFGRYGLLLDVVTDDDGLNPEFCITEYPAFSILDGDYFESSFDNRKKLRWVLLDETTRKFNAQTKAWNNLRRLRVLGINAEGYYYNAVWEGDDVDGKWASFDLDNPQESPDYTLVFPTYQGAFLDFIPFTVCNIDRLGVDAWEPPPYLDVAQIAVGNYVVDSWYKMGLYQFATPTLVVTNAEKTDKDVRLGGVFWLNSPKNSSQSANAYILETSGSALAELRNAKQELKDALKYSSIRDLLDGAGANSSGDALKLRTASGTAAIADMDKTSARAIEEQIRFAAIWAGATATEAFDRITFEADTTYLGQDFQLQGVVSFLQANAQSRMLSRQNAYSILERTFSDVISNYEDNEAQLMTEEDSALGAASSNPLLNALNTFQIFDSKNTQDDEGNAVGVNSGASDEVSGDNRETKRKREDEEEAKTRKRQSEQPV